MIQIHLISVGRVRDKNLAKLCEEYARRLQRQTRLNQIEVRDAPQDRVAEALEREADGIIARIPKSAVSVALDERGEAMSSPELAQWLERSATAGRSHFAFIVGGPNGLSRRVKDKADRCLRLSRLTLTHEMARLLLLEQLYRAMSIWRGEPYHRR